MKKDIFCINCVDVTPHAAEVDNNGEFVFTCTTKGCTRFVKFPAVQDKGELQELIDEEEKINRPVAEQRAQSAEQERILTDLLK